MGEDIVDFNSLIFESYMRLMCRPAGDAILILLFRSNSSNIKEVAMKKSVIWKTTAIAVVIALVLATLPTVSVFAANETNKKIEDRWDKAVSAYDRQAMSHKSAHNMFENWLKTAKNPKASEKAEVERHLATCNSALSAAQAVVNAHRGFDAGGKVIDRAQAIESIKLLTRYVQQHVASIKNIKEHMRK